MISLYKVLKKVGSSGLINLKEPGEKMSVLIQGASLYLALNLGRLHLKVSPRALLIHSGRSSGHLSCATG